MKNEKIFFSIVILVLCVSIISCILVAINKNREDSFNEKKSEDDNAYKKRIKEIIADDFEIEKKWLVDKDKIPYNLTNAKKSTIEQTYICFSPEIRVRKINNGKKYTFAVKTNMTADGLIRNEMEENITEEEYNSLINKKEGNTIYKTRYEFLYENNIYFIDIFKGGLEGLAYMEVEFANKEEADEFVTPDWVIKDVTNDIRYKNGSLARYGIPSE